MNNLVICYKSICLISLERNKYKYNMKLPFLEINMFKNCLNQSILIIIMGLLARYSIKTNISIM